jgi:hypothetical protein
MRFCRREYKPIRRPADARQRGQPCQCEPDGAGAARPRLSFARPDQTNRTGASQTPRRLRLVAEPSPPPRPDSHLPSAPPCRRRGGEGTPFPASPRTRGEEAVSGVRDPGAALCPFGQPLPLALGVSHFAPVGLTCVTQGDRSRFAARPHAVAVLVGARERATAITFINTPRQNIN